MEGVEGHLRGGLPDGLRRQRADDLPGVGQGLHELGLHHAKHPVKGLLCQPELAEHPLGVQRGAEHVEKHQCGVALRLHAEGVVPADHHQLLRQLLYPAGHVQRVQAAAGVALLPCAKDHLRVPDEAREVHRQVHGRLAAWDELRTHHAQVVLECIKLGVDSLAGLDVCSQGVQGVGVQPVRPPARRVQVVAVLLVQVLVVELEGGKFLVLDPLPVHAVLAVQELDDVAAAVAHRPVVLDDHVLHGLHQAALDVARGGGLDSCVDETFPSSHGMKEKLLGREATKVGVLHKAAGLRAVIIGGEVRQRPPHEAIGDALALHVLLPHAGNHLGDVDEGALGAGRHHAFDVVVLLEGLLGDFAGVVAGLVENLVDLIFKGFHHCVARLRLQLVALELVDKDLHLLLGPGDGVIDDRHGFVVCYRVANADGEAVLEEPVVGGPLDKPNHFAAGRRAVLDPGDVDQRARA
mmetsp:Transcript_12899/g.36269  ORF Transcript_12899/g.36269 Transcript_12899/m.36269 type:complete len:465 (-) Transcript_12899:2165-3559(-)